jgi:hypothetical protein
LPAFLRHATIKKIFHEVICLSNQWNQDNGQEEHNQAITPAPAFSGFSSVDHYEAPPVKKHSGLGIASFSTWGGMAVLFVILLVVFFAKISTAIDFESDTVDSDAVASLIEDLPELSVISIAMFGTLVGNLVGLVLGIIGLLQKERKKVFAILGTVFNGIVIGFVLLIIFLSFMAVMAS